MKILFVLTSHSTLGATGEKTAIGRQVNRRVEFTLY